MTHGAPAKKKDDEEVIPPPDGGWGWAVVFGSFMIHIVGMHPQILRPSACDFFNQYGPSF